MELLTNTHTCAHTHTQHGGTEGHLNVLTELLYNTCQAHSEQKRQQELQEINERRGYGKSLSICEPIRKIR